MVPGWSPWGLGLLGLYLCADDSCGGEGVCWMAGL